MEKNLIKYRIKKLQFVETKWFSTNPCLEIELPYSGETVRFIPNYDYASLYDTVMPTLNVDRLGELSVIMGSPTSGIEPLYDSGYTRRRVVNPNTGIIDLPFSWDDDMMEYPF